MDGPDSYGDGQVGLAGAGRSLQQDSLGAGHEAGGCQIQDLPFIDGGVVGKVEVLQGFEGREAGLFEASFEQPVGPDAQFVFHQKLQKLQVRQAGGNGLLASHLHGGGHAREP